jgi:hypothetical protein
VPVGRFSRHRDELLIHGKHLVRNVRAKHHPRLCGSRRLRSGLACLVQLLNATGGGGQPAKPHERPVTLFDRRHDGGGNAAQAAGELTSEKLRLPEAKDGTCRTSSSSPTRALVSTLCGPEGVAGVAARRIEKLACPIAGRPDLVLGDYRFGGVIRDASEILCVD